MSQEARPRRTGFAPRRDHYDVPVLFNPYTGEPRDVRDVQSDPRGILIVPPGADLIAAERGGVAPSSHHMKGYSVEVNTGAGTVFRCSYRHDELPSALEAVRNFATREEHADIVLSRCEEPPPPMSMQEWIAKGGTTD